jgi:hypothetical protein
MILPSYQGSRSKIMFGLFYEAALPAFNNNTICFEAD